MTPPPGDARVKNAITKLLELLQKTDTPKHTTWESTKVTYNPKTGTQADNIIIKNKKLLTQNTIETRSQQMQSTIETDKDDCSSNHKHINHLIQNISKVDTNTTCINSIKINNIHSNDVDEIIDHNDKSMISNQNNPENSQDEEDDNLIIFSQKPKIDNETNENDDNLIIFSQQSKVDNNLNENAIQTIEIEKTADFHDGISGRTRNKNNNL